MTQTPITKLAAAAENGLMTSSPALWEEHKKTLEETFALEIRLAFTEGCKDLCSSEEYYAQRFGEGAGK